MKKIIFLLFLASLLRLPFLLLRAEPGSDELSCFLQILHMLDIRQLNPSFIFINYDKPVFMFANAPFVGLIYSLTGNPTWAVSWFPFVLNLVSVWLVYHLVCRLYDEKTGFWAGLLWATLPVLVKRSALLSPENFYLFLMLVGMLFLHRAMKTGHTFWLAAAAFALACLGRVRPEGFGLFIVVMVMLIMARRFNQNYSFPAGKILLIFGSMGIFAVVVPSLAMIAVFGSPNEIYAQGVIGKILGKLTFKLNHMLDLRTSGGFLSGNKLQYVKENLYLIPAVSTVLAYDTLKTVFILPTRLFPPLLFIFFGAFFFRQRLPDQETLLFERILLFSLIPLLAYPLLIFLSHSRYLFHCIPVFIIFIAAGIRVVDERLSRMRFKSLSSYLLGGLFFCYLALFYFVIYLPMFKDRVLETEREPVRAWLAKEFDAGPKAVMIIGTAKLPFHINKTEYTPPQKISLQNGLWGYWEPLSLENTLAVMHDKGIRTLVVSNQLRGRPDKRRQDYLSLTRFQIMGDNDESLEMMRSPDGSSAESRCDDFYKEFISLIDHCIFPVRLSLREKISYSNDRDTLFIFSYTPDVLSPVETDSLNSLE